MKLIFKINQEYDKKMIFEFMPKSGIKKRAEFIKLLRIDKEDLIEATRKAGQNTKKIVNLLVAKKYKTILPYMKNSVKSYQASWNKINDSFFSLVAKKTGYNWKYKKYYCIVSAYHDGISSWGGNIIVRRWSINPDTQRPITAHELVLSHFWTILDKNKISQKWSDNKKWQYAEIFSWILLGLDDDFLKFWPWLLKKHRFPLDHEYPKIVPLQKKLRDVYLKGDNFKEFINRVIK